MKSKYIHFLHWRENYKNVNLLVTSGRTGADELSNLFIVANKRDIDFQQFICNLSK